MVHTLHAKHLLDWRNKDEFKPLKAFSLMHVVSGSDHDMSPQQSERKAATCEAACERVGIHAPHCAFQFLQINLKKRHRT